MDENNKLLFRYRLIASFAHLSLLGSIFATIYWFYSFPIKNPALVCAFKPVYYCNAEIIYGGWLQPMIVLWCTPLTGVIITVFLISLTNEINNFVKEHVYESLNFQIKYAKYFLGFHMIILFFFLRFNVYPSLLSVVLLIDCIVFLIMFASQVKYSVIGAFNAFDGKQFKYPI
jgi:uncharacterized Tic20 family protein